MKRLLIIAIVLFGSRPLLAQLISFDGAIVCPGTTISHILDSGPCAGKSLFTTWTITGTGNTINTNLTGIDDFTVSVTWQSNGILTCNYSPRLAGAPGCTNIDTFIAVATVFINTPVTLNISSSINPSNLCANQSVSFSSLSPCIGCFWEISSDGVNFNTLEIENSSPASTSFNIENSYGGIKYDYSTPLSFRLKQVVCPNVISYSAVVGPYKFYPPAPVIPDIATDAPQCPGGSTGSIIVTHSSIATGQSFYYNINQYFSSDPTKTCSNNPISDFDPSWKTNAINSTGNSSFEIKSGQSGNLTDKSVVFRTGWYSITVESSLDQSDNSITCPTETFFVCIKEPPLMSVSVADIDIIKTACSGSNDGAVTFKVTNGVGPFTWEIKDGSNNVVKSSTQPTLKSATEPTPIPVEGLSAGGRTVKVIDNGCLMADGVTYINIESAAFTIGSGPVLEFTPSVTHPTCNSDGKIELTSTPNLSGVTYYFSLNGESEVVENNNTHSYLNLPSGDYTITGSINHDCTATPLEITLNTIPSLSIGGNTISNPTCSNSADGSITITGISKDSPFPVSYNYDVDGNTGTSTSSPAFILPISLAAGSHNLKVTDACNGNQVYQSTVILSNPSQISITNPGNQTLACFDGITNALITVQGGGTSNYTLDVKDINGSLLGYPKNLQPVGQFDLNPIGVGSYQVVATENCTIAGVPKSNGTMNFTVTSNATEKITTTITKLKYSNGFDLSCAENDNGRIQVAVSGGIQGTNPRYIVQVLNGNVSVGSITNVVEVGGTVTYTISGLTESIDYKVNVTDYNSCSKTYDVTALTSPTSLAISNSNFTNLGNIDGVLYSICKGDANGIYTTQISGGNPAYTAELFKKTLFTDNFPVTPFQTVTGSTGSAQFNNLGAGFYQLIVADQQGCSTSQTFEIKEANASVKVETIISDVYTNGFNTSCYGGNDGNIKVEASGGVGNYTYILSWDNNGTQSSSITKSGTSHAFTGLSAIRADGTTIKYTIELKDELGCAWQGGNPVSQFKELTFPQQLKFYRSIESNTVLNYEIPCKGDNATVRFTSEGGEYPHQVTLNGDTKEITSASSYVEFILPAGNYIADFTDALSCTALSQTFDLREPSSHISINIGTITPPVCIGGSDGQVNVSASGGVTGSLGQEYTFQLKDSGASAYDDSQTGTQAMFLKPANDFLSKDYDAIAIDAYGCTSEASFIMPVNPTPLTLNATELVSPSCYDGTNGYITLKSKNQTYINGNQLKFKITGGHYGNTIQEALVASETHTFTNLEGTDLHGYSDYKAWVEDANACVMEAYQYQSPLKLPSHDSLQLDLLQSIRPSCFNGSDGSLYIQVSGGVSPYQYSHDNITFNPISADKIFTNQLTAGQYTYYLKDGNYDPTQPTCLNTIQFEVLPGRALQLETTRTNISCKGGNDGSIDLTVNLNNRNANEIFDLNRLSLAWVNNSVSSLPFTTIEDVASLARGTYTVKVLYDVDSLVCTQQKTVTVLEPSSTFRITEVKTYEASCGGLADGKAVVTWAGGWPNSISYYKLDNGTWQPVSASSFVLSNLAPGSHQVAIAQQNYLCTDIKNFEITSATLALSVGEVIKPSCPLLSDGAVVLSNMGGGIEYAFENGAYQLLPSFTGLAAGTYHFVARKFADPTCSSAIVEVVMTDPADCGSGPLALSLLSTSIATCSASSDGGAQVLASGGVPPYRYFWDGSISEGTTTMTGLSVGAHTVVVKDGVNAVKTITLEITAYEELKAEQYTSLASCATTCDGTAQLLINGGSGQYAITWADGATGETRTNLCVGTYAYTITDATDQSNKCLISGTVTIDHYPSLSLSQQNAAAPVCPGGTDGFVFVAVEGGSGQYQLQWTNQNLSTGKITTLLGVAPGTYSLTATDKVLGCNISQDFTIPDALPITVTSTEVTPPSCNGGTDGLVTLTLTNAISPLVQWSNGQVGLKATNLKAGIYQYSITSAAGCSTTGSVEVKDRPKLEVSATTVSPTCFGLCNAEASLIVMGGTTPYIIEWSHGPKTLTTKNLCADTYTYTVSDKYNCTIKSSAVITAPDPIAIKLESKQDVSCNAGKDGELKTSASGGTGTLTYLWNTGNETANLSDVGVGDYKLSVSDANACIARKTYTITEPALLLVKSAELIDPSCPASTYGQINVTVIGGKAPYQYLWSDQFNGASHTGLSAGDYSLTVTDNKGCTLSKKYSLTAAVPVEIVNVTKKDPSCFGDKDGQISIEATGGKSPYSFNWANGNTQAKVTALPAGTYSVEVKDINNCSVKGSYTLIEHAQPVITGIASKTVICTGSTAVMQPNGDWSRYEWKSPKGILFTSEKYVTSDLGTHTLKVWDQHSCPAETSFIIEVSDNALKADFLRLSEAVVFKPVVFVDISVPVPTTNDWVLPSDVVVNRKTSEMVEVVFVNPGFYEIGMKGTLDRCQSELFKIVEVTEAKENKGGRVASSDEEKLDVFVYPNPASNELNIQVSSDSRNEIVLRLVTSLENRQVAYERLDGQLDYLVRWDVASLTPGVFFLVYEQNGKVYSKRVLVVR